MRETRPPRWLEAVVSWALPKGLSGEAALGDLSEAYDERAGRSLFLARLWYFGQAATIVLHRLLPGGAPRRESDSDFLLDLRWSLRSLARHPGFSIAVIGVLGLGLGANIAVFSVVDGTLRNTSWWQDADRAVAIWPGTTFSQGQIGLYGEEQAAYRSMGGYLEVAFALQTPEGESESINGVFISPSLFAELAAQPFVGRGLTDDDAWFGAERVVVIGEALWRRSFGADPDVVGRRVDIAGAPATVIGVQAAGGVAPGGRTELWFPLVPDPRDDDYWKAQSYTLVGVLRDGADLNSAHDDLMAFTRRLSSLFPAFYPEDYAEGIAHVTRADEAQRRLVSTPLLLLFAGTILLVLVTALNVGNLLLGRAIDRRKELAVRTSLGASRARVVRQLLVEGLLLTFLALTLGLLAGAGGGRWIAGLFVDAAVVVSSSVVTPRVLGFSVLAAALAWLVLNGVPVLHFVRAHRIGLRVAPDSGVAVQRTLVTVQAAMATLLLVSATLLVTTVDNLRRVPLGFDPEGVLTVELSTPMDRVASPAIARELYGRLVERVEAVPGVRAAGLTGWLPLRADAPPTPINLRDAPVDPREAVRAPMHMVDPGFFAALGVSAREGRLIGTEDQALSRPGAVVVNESLARTLWPDGGAIGRMIAIDPHAWDAWTPVVGVVPDIRSGSIDGPVGPALYVALAESPSRDVTLIVRSEGPALALEASVRQAVAEVDALVPVREVSDMADVVRSAYATAWVMMGLLMLLAGLATGLGAIGIYAVLAHHVAMSRREIGVRMALGADPGVVVSGVVRSGLVLAVVGIGLGCLGALGTTRFLESLLFGVSSLSPTAYVAPAIALSLAAIVAAWIPAARAGRLPPAEVLRSD